MTTWETCNRKGYGSSGLHAPTGPFRFTDTHAYAAQCYNCKLPVRRPLASNSWSTLGAYTVIEWP